MFVEFRFEVNPSGSRKLHLQFVLDMINHSNKVSSSATSLKLGLHGDDKTVRPFEHHEADNAPNFGPAALHRAPLDSPYVAICVLCASGVIEGFALRATIRTIDPARRRNGLLHWFRESGQSAVMLAVGEDFASVVGVVVSLIAVVASMLSRNPLFDALGGVGVGIVLMGTALFSMREIKSLLVGESAHQHVRDAMDAWLK
ncbi:cation transporter [Paraburkholderia hospita]|uniref:cation transporter n=1 Tax=Paraburkholderia hospita TaxID=169430 RepID=UPI001054A4F4|nr:cation transporter [Paraburkholderia hospita]